MLSSAFSEGEQSLPLRGTAENAVRRGGILFCGMYIVKNNPFFD